jgi:hypothetical protein
VTRSLTRRTVLALATGSLVLGGLAVPALATPSVGGASALTGTAVTDTALTDTEYVCVYTRNNPQTGQRDGFCVWFPDVIPPTPLAG